LSASLRRRGKATRMKSPKKKVEKAFFLTKGGKFDVKDVFTDPDKKAPTARVSVLEELKKTKGTQQKTHSPKRQSLGNVTWLGLEKRGFLGGIPCFSKRTAQYPAGEGNHLEEGRSQLRIFPPLTRELAAEPNLRPRGEGEKDRTHGGPLFRKRDVFSGRASLSIQEKKLGDAKGTGIMVCNRNLRHP